MPSLIELSDPRVTCPDCQRRHRWTAERAGRRARCRCGETLRFPLAPPSEAPRADLELEPRWAEQEVSCPDCGAGLAPRTELCVECGFHQRLGRRISTAAQPRGVRVGQRGREEGHRELAVDLILFGVAGLALFSVLSRTAAGASAPLAGLLHIALSVGACTLTAIGLGTLFSVPFGPLLPTLAKFGQVGAASLAAMIWVHGMPRMKRHWSAVVAERRGGGAPAA